jgi:cell division protein FtsB
MVQTRTCYFAPQSQGFFVLRSLKNRLRAIAPSVLFLLLTWYFLWNAWHGARGLDAQRAQAAALDAANAHLASMNAQLAEWQTRINDLNGPTLAKDMLDNQARVVNNLADPADIVVPLPAATQNK